MYRTFTLRSTVLAAMYALALFSLPVSLVHAADSQPFNPAKEGCEGTGYMWSDTLGCANKACPDGGTPGEVRQSRTTGGQQVGYYLCNGFTGRWENYAAIRTPQSGTPSSSAGTRSR